MRDFDVSCRVLLDSLSVAVVSCGAWSVSNPQPPWRTRHGSTVGIDRDPPVRRSHPGTMMGTSERQLLCARMWLAGRTAHVDTVVGGSSWCTAVEHPQNRKKKRSSHHGHRFFFLAFGLKCARDLGPDAYVQL